MTREVTLRSAVFGTPVVGLIGNSGSLMFKTINDDPDDDDESDVVSIDAACLDDMLRFVQEAISIRASKEPTP